MVGRFVSFARRQVIGEGIVSFNEAQQQIVES